MRIRFPAVCTAAILAIAVAAPASAAPITGIDALKEWNLIVFGDLTSSSEVEGRTFVGGDLKGNSSNYFVGSNTLGLATPSATPGLTVVGNVSGGAKNLNNGANAWVGGNLDTQINKNGGGTVTAGGAINVAQNGSATIVGGPAFVQGLQDQKAALIQSLSDLSASLKTLPDFGASFTLSNGGNDATLTALDDKLNIVNIAGSLFNGGPKQIFYSGTATGTTVVNVGGTNLTFDENFQSSTSQLGQRVIWNFYEATTLNFNSQFNGTVLAPLATATNGNFIEGSAAFASFTQNGEVHLGTFDGAVPEPASWAMMIGGFGFVGGAMRRRQQGAARVALG